MALRLPRYSLKLTRAVPVTCHWVRGVTSAAARSPSPKITTAPFRAPPAEALNKMHISALVASASVPNLIYAFFLRVFGPSVTPLAQEFGFGSKLELKGEMKAVLYPIWRVDSVVEGTVKLEQKEKGKSFGNMEPALWVSTKEAYVPGNPFAPLSYLSFAVPPLPDNLVPYDPAKDLEQLQDHGLDIVPVPFTVSPLGLIKKIRKDIGKRAAWEHMIIDEAKLKNTMVACYPIMFPIYIAEYVYDQGEHGKRSFNVIMDAHDEDVTHCRVSWPPPPQLIEEGRFTQNYFVNPAPFIPTDSASVALYPLPAALALLGPPKPKLIEIYNKYMSPSTDPEDITYIDPSPMMAVQELEEPEGVDWEDQRIQSWSGEEREENGEWLDLAGRVEKASETHSTMQYLRSRAPSGQNGVGFVISTKGTIPHLERKSLGDMEEQLLKDVLKMKEELEEKKPRWLRDWDIKQLQEKIESS